MPDNTIELLTYEDFVHPLIKNRIVLDYPLDILLNRECQLQDYEKRILRALQEYNIERDRFWLWYKDKDITANEIRREETLLFIIAIFRELYSNGTDSNENDLTIGNEYNTDLTKDDLPEKTNGTDSNENDSASDNENNTDLTKEELKKLPEKIDGFITHSKEKSEIFNIKSTIKKLIDRKLGKVSIEDIRKTVERIIIIISDNSKVLIKNKKVTVKNLEEKVTTFEATISNSQTNDNDFTIIRSFLMKYLSVYLIPKGKIGSLIIRNVRDEYEYTPYDYQTDESEEIGTGNILIKGRPGSGKSTLALQMAAACTNGPNHYSSIYISFEESIKNIMLKARSFNWEDKFFQVQFLNDIDEFSSPEEIGAALERLLTQPRNCQFQTMCKEPEEFEDYCKVHKTKLEDDDFIAEPCVLLPLLSPRGLSGEDSSSDGLFWERYRQLDRLLTGIESMRRNGRKRIPDIRMVCIDSLNVFGNKPLSRSELFKLFDLFKSKGIIGVFTDEQESDALHVETGEQVEDYLADMIIQLYMEEDNGYTSRYFEVTKSRYQHQVYGKHPIRLRGLETQQLFRKQWGNIEKVSESISNKLIGIGDIEINEDEISGKRNDKNRNLNGNSNKNQNLGDLETNDGNQPSDDLIHNYYSKIRAYFYSKKVHLKDYVTIQVVS